MLKESLAHIYDLNSQNFSSRCRKMDLPPSESPLHIEDIGLAAKTPSQNSCTWSRSVGRKNKPTDAAMPCHHLHCIRHQRHSLHTCGGKKKTMFLSQPLHECISSAQMVKICKSKSDMLTDLQAYIAYIIVHLTVNRWCEKNGCSSNSSGLGRSRRCHVNILEAKSHPSWLNSRSATRKSP